MDNRLTVLVACYNEEATIEKKIQDLFHSASYIHEVIIVDDYSSDNTSKITQNLKKQFRRLTYLKNSSKKGKALSIRMGIKHAKTDLIAISDADVLVEKGALAKVVKQFDNPKVGMVGADLKPVIKNSKTGRIGRVVKVSDKLFHRIRLLLSRIDSLPLLHSQLVVIRKSIGIYPKAGIRADDVDTAIRMRLRGYKTILAPKAWFLQTISDKDDFAKRLRRDGGTIVTLWRYRNLLFNFHYGMYGLICFPFCFGLYFFQPFLVVFILLLPLLLLPSILKVLYLLFLLNINYVRSLIYYDTTLILAIFKVLASKGAVLDSWSTKRNN